MDEASSGRVRGWWTWDDCSSSVDDNGDASTGRAATVFSVFSDTFWNRIALGPIGGPQRKRRGEGGIFQATKAL